jgi:hypothetical protein
LYSALFELHLKSKNLLSMHQLVLAAELVRWILPDSSHAVTNMPSCISRLHLIPLPSKAAFANAASTTAMLLGVDVRPAVHWCLVLLVNQAVVRPLVLVNLINTILTPGLNQLLIHRWSWGYLGNAGTVVIIQCTELVMLLGILSWHNRG